MFVIADSSLKNTGDIFFLCEEEDNDYDYNRININYAIVISGSSGSRGLVLISYIN